MAIKFVDIEPDGEGKPKRTKQSDAPSIAREPDADALKESVDPELSHPKPGPKMRGRKQGEPWTIPSVHMSLGA